MKSAPCIAVGIAFVITIVATAEARQTVQPLKYVGSRSLSAAVARPATQEIGLEFRQGPEEETRFSKNVTGSVKPARVPSSHVPTTQGLPFSTASGGSGFLGLTHADQRLADGGNAFSSEPPDQCLAVGNGLVLEGVNSAFRVRSVTGAVLSPVVSMNTFFGLPVAIDRNAIPPVYGPFTSDPHVHRQSPASVRRQSDSSAAN